MIYRDLAKAQAEEQVGLSCFESGFLSSRKLRRSRECCYLPKSLLGKPCPCYHEAATASDRPWKTVRASTCWADDVQGQY